MSCDCVLKVLMHVCKTEIVLKLGVPGLLILFTEVNGVYCTPHDYTIAGTYNYCNLQIM